MNNFTVIILLRMALIRRPIGLARSTQSLSVSLIHLKLLPAFGLSIETASNDKMTKKYIYYQGFSEIWICIIVSQSSWFCLLFDGEQKPETFMSTHTHTYTVDRWKRVKDDEITMNNNAHTKKWEIKKIHLCLTGESISCCCWFFFYSSAWGYKVCLLSLVNL